jgi:hypothetical protein
MPAYLPALLVLLAIIAAGAWSGYRNPDQTPPEPFGLADKASAVVETTVTLAAVSWVLVWVAVAFAPLALLVWWVAS